MELPRFDLTRSVLRQVCSPTPSPALASRALFQVVRATARGRVDEPHRAPREFRSAPSALRCREVVFRCAADPRCAGCRSPCDDAAVAARRGPKCSMTGSRYTRASRARICGPPLRLEFRHSASPAGPEETGKNPMVRLGFPRPGAWNAKAPAPAGSPVRPARVPACSAIAAQAAGRMRNVFSIGIGRTRFELDDDRGASPFPPAATI